MLKLEQFDQVGRGFSEAMQNKSKNVDKLGLTEYHPKLFEN